MNAVSLAKIHPPQLLFLIVAIWAAIATPVGAETCPLPSWSDSDGVVALPSGATAAGAETVSHIYVFFDGSGSMAGYASSNLAPTPQARAYADIATGLHASLQQAFRATVDLHRFGRNIHPFPQSEISKLADAKTYLRQSDDIHESRIDEVLKAAAADVSGALYLIVTDLFLTEQHLQRSGPAALQTPVATILRAGRAIGLTGIRSGFLGTVHDLPSKGTYSAAKERPFYILAIGKSAAVLRFQHQINIDYLRNLPEDAHHFFLFTTQVVRQILTETTWPRDAFRLGEGAQPSLLLRGEEAEALQQIRLAGDFTPPEAKISVAELLTPSTFRPNELKIKQRIWMHPPGVSTSGCTPWISLDQRPDQLALQPDGNAITLRFSSPAATRDMLPQQVHLFRFEVQIATIDVGAAAARWIQEWSFDAAGEAGLLAKKPTFFPTLNLARLARTMTAIVQDEFRAQPVFRFGLVAQYR